jgi:uncharacterized protein (DUF58 family)
VIAPSRDPRLLGYTAATVVLVAIAIFFGKPALVAAAAPFATGLAIGLRRRAPVEFDATITLTQTSIIEGDSVEGGIQVTVPRGVQAVTRLDLGGVWEPRWPAHGVAWQTTAGSPVEPFAITATGWGRASIGSVVIESRVAGGLLTWDTTIELPDRVRVLPPAARVRELLPPPESRAFLGSHTSRAVGDGFDFAEIRSFQPGDRLRDLNWRATARTGDPQVNRRHPERNGEVVLLIDTFADGLGSLSITQQRVIGRAAHAGWAIAQLHLAAQDRVGLITRGRLVRTLAPGTGNRARYAMLEALLDVGTAVQHGQADRVDLARLRVSPAALVIALTPLTRTDLVDDLHHLRHTGRSVVAVVVETLDLLPTPVDQADATARRMLAHEWRLQREALADEGFPVTTWSADTSLASAVAALRRTQHVRMRR